MPGICALRALLRRTAPCKLTGTGRFKGFQPCRAGLPYGNKARGLTRALEARIYSGHNLPLLARRASGPRPGGAWRGPSGGLRRGTAVDSQLSAIINGHRPASGRQLRLTRTVLAALANEGLQPVLAQRSVYDERAGVASAADVIALGQDGALVVVEVKCGYDEGRTAPAQFRGRAQRLRTPLAQAPDCLLHRHMAQLAATRAMLSRESATLAALQQMGIEQLSGLLLYATDVDVEYVWLDRWWVDKGKEIVSAL